MVRGGTKQNEKKYISIICPRCKAAAVLFNHIVRSPRIALTAVLLISFYMEPSEIHNTVCAFVYRVRDCKHPVPAIYIHCTG